MRLDKLLAHSGFGTRKQVRGIIKDELVQVDGEVVIDHGHHVDPDKQEIRVQNVVVNYQEFVYFMLNKPAGVISATEDRMHETVLDLLEPSDMYHEPHPVGRLDLDTEGLLILTNDGKLTHHLTSPNRHVSKVYFAVVEGLVDESDVAAFAEGLTLDDGYETLPGELTILEVDEAEGYSQIELIIQEGKFHQVKRMFEAVDKEVQFLKRLKMGKLSLDETLAPGEYRPLIAEEVQLLQDS